MVAHIAVEIGRAKITFSDNIFELAKERNYRKVGKLVHNDAPYRIGKKAWLKWEKGHGCMALL